MVPKLACACWHKSTKARSCWPERNHKVLQHHKEKQGKEKIKWDLQQQRRCLLSVCKLLLVCIPGYCFTSPQCKGCGWCKPSVIHRQCVKKKDVRSISSLCLCAGWRPEPPCSSGLPSQSVFSSSACLNLPDLFSHCSCTSGSQGIKMSILNHPYWTSERLLGFGVYYSL